ncbi:tRNA (guanosine(37)-N1)-methyltransferase TrmD [Candidatus Cyanaurora vandensis]|uniref:tRNA (guanosine(37)-N1)-methyltransferase TrmD n=1 Tax=Candidatus Cyanaurora vandensis TaxID=2714958 RepID=UPI00257AB787|nr:tRNA (guanosine(37)-N1)-methyltransferase TrmD [Candidatus Cyanaurora vandensis]
MRIDLVTLFPEFFSAALACSLVGRALAKGIAEVHLTNPRDFSPPPYHRVDDEPYGGGVGMVLMCEPLFKAVESLPILDSRAVILTTPQGRPLTQALLKTLSTYQQLVILCGHYEGVDERVRQHLVTLEVSLGDFVLTGGEVPALAIVDGVVRLLPGTVGKAQSLQEESFEDGLLEYPHYTRPRSFRGWEVPGVLLSGHHQQIAQWRQHQRRERTRLRRPDLL